MAAFSVMSRFYRYEQKVKASTISIKRPGSAQILPGGKQWLSWVGKLYCRMFHRSISTPVNGRYHCWKCLREFEMEW